MKHLPQSCQDDTIKPSIRLWPPKSKSVSGQLYASEETPKVETMPEQMTRNNFESIAHGCVVRLQLIYVTLPEVAFKPFLKRLS